MLDLQLLSDCAISVSSSRAAVTTAGGFTRAAVTLDATVCRGYGCVGAEGCTLRLGFQLFVTAWVAAGQLL